MYHIIVQPSGHVPCCAVHTDGGSWKFSQRECLLCGSPAMPRHDSALWLDGRSRCSCGAWPGRRSSAAPRSASRCWSSGGWRRQRRRGGPGASQRRPAGWESRQRPAALRLWRMAPMAGTVRVGTRQSGPWRWLAPRRRSGRTCGGCQLTADAVQVEEHRHVWHVRAGRSVFC